MLSTNSSTSKLRARPVEKLPKFCVRLNGISFFIGNSLQRKPSRDLQWCLRGCMYNISVVRTGSPIKNATMSWKLISDSIVNSSNITATSWFDPSSKHKHTVGYCDTTHWHSSIQFDEQPPWRGPYRSNVYICCFPGDTVQIVFGCFLFLFTIDSYSIVLQYWTDRWR